MRKQSLVVGKVSSRAMDCKRQAVQIPPLCPPIQVTKAHFGEFAGMAEKASVPHFPYFIYGPLESIVYECHGLAHLWEMHWRTYHSEDMLKFSILQVAADRMVIHLEIKIIYMVIASINMSPHSLKVFIKHTKNNND